MNASRNSEISSDLKHLVDFGKNTVTEHHEEVYDENSIGQADSYRNRNDQEVRDIDIELLSILTRINEAPVLIEMRRSLTNEPLNDEYKQGFRQLCKLLND